MSRKKNYGYIGVAGISVIVRELFMPNPFEVFQYGELMNYAFSAVLPFVSFAIIGLFYRKGSAPLLGSLGFLGTYIGLTYFTMYMIKFADWIGVIG